MCVCFGGNLGLEWDGNGLIGIAFGCWWLTWWEAPSKPETFLAYIRSVGSEFILPLILLLVLGGSSIGCFNYKSCCGFWVCFTSPLK